jgi:tRNA modification GTPase
LAAIFFRAADSKSLADQAARSLVLGWWMDPASLKALDEVLCVWFKAPHSFTGEDVVEVHAHGGTYHLQALLQGLLKAGARLAKPGEFTQRAFVNGRMDLTRAEAVVDLIQSGTALSHAAAARQLAGGLMERVETLREGVIDCSALVEAAVDFPDEEEQLLPKAGLLAKVRASRKNMRELLDTAREGRMLTQGMRVTLAGLPNVGKSSLMNALLGEARSIVTPVAGTTRDYIEELLSIQGFPVRLTDTAGLRDSADAAEQEGVKRSHERMLSADLVLLVLDPTRALQAGELDLVNSVSAEVIFVVTKDDLDSLWKPVDLKTGHAVVRVSSKTRVGLEELKERILDVALKGKASALLDKVVLTQARHEDAMRRAEISLGHVEDTLVAGKLSAEFLSGDLRETLDALGEIVGKTSREDVVNAIFSKFCIGK